MAQLAPTELGGLPKGARDIFSRIYQDSRENGTSQKSAAKAAWSAIKKAGYYQDKNGLWKRPKEILLDPLWYPEGFNTTIQGYIGWWEYWYPTANVPLPARLAAELGSGTAGLAMPVSVGTKKREDEEEQSNAEDPTQPMPRDWRKLQPQLRQPTYGVSAERQGVKGMKLRIGEISSTATGLALKIHIDGTPENLDEVPPGESPSQAYDQYRADAYAQQYHNEFMKLASEQDLPKGLRATLLRIASSRDDTEESDSHGDCMCKRREAIERFLIQEKGEVVKMRMLITERTLQEADKTIPFIARILAAYPTLSQNKRRYSAELLRGALRPYIGKPLILDHDYTNTWKVMGVITGGMYGGDMSEYTGRRHEGLWLDAVGLMPEELYGKVKGWCPADGGPCVPPMVRGVSIGGEGEGDPYMGGIDIKQFLPQELSITAFPGIPDAHIASFEKIGESIRPSFFQNQ